jgi:hypothetical protein
MLGEGLDKPTSPHITWIDASHNLLKVKNPEVETEETPATRKATGLVRNTERSALSFNGCELGFFDQHTHTARQAACPRARVPFPVLERRRGLNSAAI